MPGNSVSLRLILCRVNLPLVNFRLKQPLVPCTVPFSPVGAGLDPPRKKKNLLHPAW